MSEKRELSVSDIFEFLFGSKNALLAENKGWDKSVYADILAKDIDVALSRGVFSAVQQNFRQQVEAKKGAQHWLSLRNSQPKPPEYLKHYWRNMLPYLIRAIKKVKGAGDKQKQIAEELERRLQTRVTTLAGNPEIPQVPSPSTTPARGSRKSSTSRQSSERKSMPSKTTTFQEDVQAKIKQRRSSLTSGTPTVPSPAQTAVEAAQEPAGLPNNLEPRLGNVGADTTVVPVATDNASDVMNVNIQPGSAASAPPQQTMAEEEMEDAVDLQGIHDFPFRPTISSRINIEDLNMEQKMRLDVEFSKFKKEFDRLSNLYEVAFAKAANTKNFEQYNELKRTANETVAEAEKLIQNFLAFVDRLRREADDWETESDSESPLRNPQQRSPIGDIKRRASVYAQNFVARPQTPKKTPQKTVTVPTNAEFNARRNSIAGNLNLGKKPVTEEKAPAKEKKSAVEATKTSSSLLPTVKVVPETEEEKAARKAEGIPTPPVTPAKPAPEKKEEKKEEKKDEKYVPPVTEEKKTSIKVGSDVVPKKTSTSAWGSISGMFGAKDKKEAAYKNRYEMTLNGAIEDYNEWSKKDTTVKNETEAKLQNFIDNYNGTPQQLVNFVNGLPAVYQRLLLVQAARPLDATSDDRVTWLSDEYRRATLSMPTAEAGNQWNGLLSTMRKNFPKNLERKVTGSERQNSLVPRDEALLDTDSKRSIPWAEMLGEAAVAVVATALFGEVAGIEAAGGVRAAVTGTGEITTEETILSSGARFDPVTETFGIRNRAGMSGTSSETARLVVNDASGGGGINAAASQNAGRGPGVAKGPGGPASASSSAAAATLGTGDEKASHPDDTGGPDLEKPATEGKPLDVLKKQSMSSKLWNIVKTGGTLAAYLAYLFASGYSISELETLVEEETGESAETEEPGAPTDEGKTETPAAETPAESPEGKKTEDVELKPADTRMAEDDETETREKDDEVPPKDPEKKKKEVTKGDTPKKKKDLKRKWEPVEVRIDEPLLRPEFYEGGSNFVTEFNKDVKMNEIDQLSWASFKNYNWEANTQSDNPLHSGVVAEEAVRFSGSLIGEEVLPEQRKLAKQWYKDHDFGSMPYRVPLVTAYAAKEFMMDVIPLEGQSAQRDINPHYKKSAKATEKEFHNVDLPDWFSIKDTAPLETFTASDGTQFPDTERLHPGRISSYWWSRYENQNQFIFETQG